MPPLNETACKNARSRLLRHKSHIYLQRKYVTRKRYTSTEVYSFFEDINMCRYFIVSYPIFKINYNFKKITSVLYVYPLSLFAFRRTFAVAKVYAELYNGRTLSSAYVRR